MGIDLRDRLPKTNQILLFDEAGFDEIRGIYNRGRAVTATNVLLGYVFAEVVDSFDAALGNVQHEVGHLAAARVVKIVKASDGFNEWTFVANGYTPFSGADDPLVEFDEALTEIMNLRVMGSYWPRHAALRSAGLHKHMVGYASTVIVTEEIVRESSRRNGITFKRGLNELHRGSIMHDLSKLRPIFQTLGAERSRLIAHWPRQGTALSTIEQGWEIATALDLGAAIEKLDDLSQGQSVDVLADLVPGARVIGRHDVHEMRRQQTTARLGAGIC